MGSGGACGAHQPGPLQVPRMDRHTFRSGSGSAVIDMYIRPPVALQHGRTSAESSNGAETDLSVGIQIRVKTDTAAASGEELQARWPAVSRENRRGTISNDPQSARHVTKFG